METSLANLSLENLKQIDNHTKIELDKLLSSYSVFQETYYYDPVGFAQDCIDWSKGDSLTDYQIEILNNLIKYKRVCIRSPHGVGKSAAAAIAILWFALTRDGRTDWKAPITASAWRQLTKMLLPEISIWISRLKWNRIGRSPFNPRTEKLVQSLKLSTGEAFAMASDDPTALEGVHSSSVLFSYDEAKAIPDDIFDATEGAFSGAGADTKQEAFVLVFSTPGPPDGRFYEIHCRIKGTEDWWVRHITLDEALAAGRISQEWVDQRKLQWGKNSALYQNRVLGEFAVGTEDGIIPLTWVEDAIERWHEWMDELEQSDNQLPGILTQLAVDVGGGSLEGDKSTIALCYDHVKIKEIIRIEQADLRTSTMELVEMLAVIMDNHKRIGQSGGIVFIDAIGIGAGAYNRLQQLRRPSYPFIASKTTSLQDSTRSLGFSNWRSAVWWLTREILNPDSGFNVCLPPDDMIIGDLCTPQQLPTIGGKIRVESKEQIRTRLGRSPDVGDAVTMALVGPTLVEEAILKMLSGEIYDVRYQTSPIM